MREGTDYSTIDTVFLLTLAFSDTASRCIVEVVFTTIHTLYSSILNNRLYPETIPGAKLSNGTKAKTRTTKIKSLSKQLFGYVDEFNLFSIKFHRLDLFVDDVQPSCYFSDIKFLDTSTFKHFNITIKTFIRMTSKRRERVLEEAVYAINNSIAN